MDSRRYHAIFLDRDGVLNVKAADGGYVTDPDHLVLLPGAADAVRRLADAGHPVFVLTNQRWMTGTPRARARLAAVHQRLTDLLAAHGARLTGIYTCPHEIGQCRCRKPLPDLVYEALRTRADLRIEPSCCALIGDSESDIDLGAYFGMTTIRIAPAGTPTAATYRRRDLASAVGLLTRR
jgi:D-glycero-D-manno-heptose 1,7-bisphosphate phosphatase